MMYMMGGTIPEPTIVLDEIGMDSSHIEKGDEDRRINL